MPSLLIDIEGRTSKFTDALEQVSRQIAGFKKKTESMLEGASKVTFGLISADAIERSLGSLKDFFAEGIAKAREMETEMLRLNAVLKSTGMSAGFTASQIDEMVEALSKRTNFDDDSIRKAATALLRFRDIQGETFRQTLNMAPNVASALGTDLTNAAVILGKAVQGSAQELRALKDAGINLGQGQLDLIARMSELGDKAGIAKVLFDELKKSIGDLAEAETKGAAGATARLSNAWDDLKKTLGAKFLQSNTQNFDLLTEKIKSTTEETKKLDLSFQHIVEVIGNLGPLSPFTPISVAMSAAFSKDKLEGMHEVTGKIKGVSGRPVDEELAAEAAIKHKTDILVEAFFEERQKITERQAADAEKFSRIGLQQRQFALDKEQAANENAYKQGLESLQDYYDKQANIIARGANSQLDALGAQGEAAEKAFAAIRTPTDPDKLKFLARIQDIANQSDQVRNEATLKSIKNSDQRTEAEQTEIDAILRVTAALHEQNGELEQAAKLNQDIDNRKLKLRAEHGDESAISQLAAKTQIDERTKLEKRILQLHNQDEVALRNLQSEEEKLQALRETGGITEIEQLKRIDAARLQAVAGLKERAAAQRAEAARSGDITGKLQADAAAADAAVATLEASVGGLEKQFRDINQGSMQQFFEDFASGTKSMSALFDDAVRSIVAGISRIAAQNVSEQLFGKEGWLGKVAPMLAELFGGSASGGGYMASSSIPIERRAKGGAYDMGREITRFDMGGVVTSPRFFRAAMGIGLMGEAGPEAIMPLHRGADGKLGVRGAGGINITMNVATPDVRSFAESRGQLAKKAALAIAGAKRNL